MPIELPGTQFFSGLACRKSFSEGITVREDPTFNDMCTMQLNMLLFRVSVQEEGGVRGSRNSISDQANQREKVPDNRKFGAEHL